MNLYFSCSLTGGRSDEAVYAAIVDHLLSRGHTVPTAHLARAEVMELEEVVEPSQVFRRDREWIKGCDALIAEVSTPSHGVGYEIALGLSLGKPVLCLHRAQAKVSKMLTGNDAPTLRVVAYRDGHELLEWLDGFLDELDRRWGRVIPDGAGPRRP
jgi:nucleoside 2-deoxyribosyltransferase